MQKLFSIKKLILNSERRVEHPFGGRNTQQPFHAGLAWMYQTYYRPWIITRYFSNQKNLSTPWRFSSNWILFMECYATPCRLWRESRILYFLQSPPIPRISPLSLFVGIFSLFAPSTVGVHVSYFSIWIESKPIVLESSCSNTDNFD